MTEQILPRLHQAVGLREEALKKQQVDGEIHKLVAEWDYLMSPAVIEALRQAGLILSKVSASDVHIYTTLRPDYRYQYENNNSFDNSFGRLHWKPQLSLVWDIKTKNQGRDLTSIEWKEITVNARKAQNDQPNNGYVFNSKERNFHIDSSEDSIYEALDQACLSPLLRWGEQRGSQKEYEVFRVRYQSLLKTHASGGWTEIDERFREKSPERYRVG